MEGDNSSRRAFASGVSEVNLNGLRTRKIGGELLLSVPGLLSLSSNGELDIQTFYTRKLTPIALSQEVEDIAPGMHLALSLGLTDEFNRLKVCSIALTGANAENYQGLVGENRGTLAQRVLGTISHRVAHSTIIFTDPLGAIRLSRNEETGDYESEVIVLGNTAQRQASLKTFRLAGDAPNKADLKRRWDSDQLNKPI